MLPMPDLTTLEVQALLDDMRLGPYNVQPHAHLLRLDHTPIMDLSMLVDDGQVDCKLEGSDNLRISTRSATMTLTDRRQQVPVTAGAATGGAAHYDKMVATGVKFKGPRIGRWVTIPTSCGPINGVSRNGTSLTIVTQGKERLASSQTWVNRTFKRGGPSIDAIRDLLLGAGESADHIRLPGLPDTLGADLVVKFDDNWWQHIRTVVSALARQHQYDARGDYQLRSWPDAVSYTFTDGEGGNLLTDADVTYPSWSDYNDGQGIFNGVRVVGAKVGKTTPTYTAWLPAEHPMSPESMARNGKPYRLARLSVQTKARNEAQCRELAEREVNTLSRELIKVTADALPMWLLEPGDVYAISTAKTGYLEQVADEFTLPMIGGSPMSVGATKYVGRPEALVNTASWGKPKGSGKTSKPKKRRTNKPKKKPARRTPARRPARRSR